MCIGLWSLEHPEYALILCSNRDEYLSRPTLNADFHSFKSQARKDYVLSGRDLQAGGSWLGINRDGKVALLTNITEVHGVHHTTRGQLVSSFLEPGGPDVVQYVGTLATGVQADYAGFNLLLFSPARASGEAVRGGIAYGGYLITNHGGGGAITARPVSGEESRLGGVSNGVDGVDAADWPKVKKGCSLLDSVLSEDKALGGLSPESLAEKLFEVLTWQPEPPPANRSELRMAVQIAPHRMSASLSPDAPADGPEYYGTRLSTILLVKRDGNVLFVERDIWKLDKSGSAVRGDPRDDRVFKFELNGV